MLRLAIGVAGWLFVASVVPTQAQTWSNPPLGGYLGVSYNGAANSYNAGYTMYVALLGRTQYPCYSPNFEASLEIGTWMGSTCNPGIYCDIEGGPGAGGGYGKQGCKHEPDGGEQSDSRQFGGFVVARTETFDLIKLATRAGKPLDEYGVLQFVMQRFQEKGLVTNWPPIVGANVNAADSHYSPPETGSASIRRGDLVLLDLWAKLDQPDAVYYDITWMAFCGERVTGEIQTESVRLC